MSQARDYQRECKAAIFEAWREYRAVLANLCTSAGKTFIAGDCIAELQETAPCLFLADTDELCQQPVDKFGKFFGIRAQVEKADRHASHAARVVVGSAQTLINPRRRERFAPDHFGYIFVDEAHRGSERNKVITDYFSGARVCGITATAFRAKLKDLSDFYEFVAYELGVFDLVGQGYITPLKVMTLPVQVDISGVHQSAGDYDANELETTIAPFYDAIIDKILEHAGKRQIIAFLPLIRSSLVFAKMCQDKGLTARHVDGKSDDRRDLLTQFENRDFQVLCNSSLLTTGWDCPTVDCLVNLVPTRSAGMFRQKVGRILRTLPGVVDGIESAADRKLAIAASAKPDALILDLLWQTERFGLVGPSDLIAANADERVAIEKKIREKRSAADLEAIAAEVQAEKEEQLKNALEAAAKKSRGFAGMIDAAMVAVQLHIKSLLEYEPVAKWQEAKPSDKQIQFLEKHGINPETVKDKGHASAVIDVVAKRRERGRCTLAEMAALMKLGITGAETKTSQEAYDILRNDTPFPFGKHAKAGRTFCQIPRGYWEWLDDQPWVERAFPTVWQYRQQAKPKPEPLGKGWWK